MITNPAISNLGGMVDSLPAREKALFRRIYTVTTAVGELRVPQSMISWVKQRFGSVGAVTSRRMIRVAIMITLEETLFNRLRSFRPTEFREKNSMDTQLADASEDDLFSNPKDNTPEDLFGRVVGKHCITASNIAKYDGLHGMVIFNDFDPLHFSREQIIDYIDVGREWAKRAQAKDPQTKYFFFIWNCRWRAGASIQHGHAQVMLARDRHYSKIERLRQVALDYRQNYGSNYFTDLFQAHQSVGCAVERAGVRILAHLTPFKDNEVILLSEELDLSLKNIIYEVLACFRDEIGVSFFNLGLATPPLAETEESWEGFPVITWLVDRGDPGTRASDVGGMEIYASSVVSSDPFELARQLRGCLV